MTDLEAKAREIAESDDWMIYYGGPEQGTNPEILAQMIFVALRDARNSGYEAGYEDGGSSTFADFEFAVSELSIVELIDGHTPFLIVKDVIEAARNSALEEAAGVADSEREFWEKADASFDDDGRRSEQSAAIAARIRALKDTTLSD